MQKTLIVLVVGLLAVGCTSLRDRVVGEYEYKLGGSNTGSTHRYILLENGIREVYVSSPKLNINGRKQEDAKWSVVKEEIHVKGASGLIEVYRINKDKSITYIAEILDGKRTDYSKGFQQIWIKIK